MEAVPFEPAFAEAWNALNRDARNGHFIFDRGFMEYHAERFRDASLVMLDGGRLVGLIPANRDGDRIVSHQGLTFGGLVTGDALTEDVMRMLDACADTWRATGAQRLVYKPLPWIYHRSPAQADLYWLFRRGAALTRRDVTSSIRLAAPGPSSSRRRRGAAKAAREGLVVGPSHRLEAYWEMLTKTLAERHGVRPTHSFAEIRLLAGRFPQQIRLYAAEDPRSGEILAGVLLFLTDQVAHAQYIAANPRGRAAGALDAVVFALLKAPPANCAWLDFGISNEDGGRVLNTGLIRQKEEFGAGAVVHDEWEVHL